MAVKPWRFSRMYLLLVLVFFISNIEAAYTVSFTGLSLNGEYLYQADEYRHYAIVLDASTARAQADFFPPDDWPCVWIRSSLSSLGDPVWRSIQTIDYCGGIGWRHWIVEPQCCEWHKWVIEIGLPGEVEPTDTLGFFVRRRR